MPDLRSLIFFRDTEGPQNQPEKVVATALHGVPRLGFIERKSTAAPEAPATVGRNTPGAADNHQTVGAYRTFFQVTRLESISVQDTYAVSARSLRILRVHVNDPSDCTRIVALPWAN
jgi:hypothetical protein